MVGILAMILSTHRPQRAHNIRGAIQTGIVAGVLLVAAYLSLV